MTTQSKIEHIIYLVREYEKDIVNQHMLMTATVELNSMLTQSSETLNPVHLIEPPAQVYLERIEAFLSAQVDDKPTTTKGTNK